MAVEAVAHVRSVGNILNDPVFLAELLDLKATQALCRCTIDRIQPAVLLFEFRYPVIDVTQCLQRELPVFCNRFSIVKLLQLI